MNPKMRGIARREGGLYLRSLSLWLGLGIVLLIVFGTSLRPAGPLELFLVNGEALTVLMTSFVAILLASAGFSREARESFDDVWYSLPIRNSEQFWGKVTGTVSVVAVLGCGLLLVIPIGWFLVGTLWTPATTTAVLAYGAQTVSVLLLSVAITSVLQCIVANLRVRYAVGLGIVVALSVAQALGIDNDAQWGVLLFPYTLGGIPYSHSALFGMFPWQTPVMWHLLFQAGLSLSLIALAAVLHQRRRDPANRSLSRLLVACLLFVGTGISAVQYQRYWASVDMIFAEQLHYDTQPNWAMVQLETGAWVREEPALPVSVSGYDLNVTWSEGALKIVASLDITGEDDYDRWPLTLHHQWSVSGVDGTAVKGWSREGNAIWLELTDVGVPTQVTVTYQGQPFLWDKQVGVISPMHFVSDQGGYLSPLMAWYPLPGHRKLANAYMGGRFWLRATEQPLVEAPVPIRLQWNGPDTLRVVTNLANDVRLHANGMRTERFEGMSDGIALLLGPLQTLHSGSLTLIGAASVIHGGGVLAGPYETLLTFYDDLIGRPIPREPIVVTPGWLSRFYGTYSHVAVNALGEPWMMHSVPLMGALPALSEIGMVAAIGAAQRLMLTRDEADLLQATASIHYGLLQAVWGRPHVHRSFVDHPVAKGMAEYTLLRWAGHVLGEDAYHDLLAADRANTLPRPANGSEQISLSVLNSLIDLGNALGDGAVTRVLGAAYDHLQTATLELDGFEHMVQTVREGGLP